MYKVIPNQTIFKLCLMEAMGSYEESSGSSARRAAIRTPAPPELMNLNLICLHNIFIGAGKASASLKTNPLLLPRAKRYFA